MTRHRNHEARADVRRPLVAVTATVLTDLEGVSRARLSASYLRALTGAGTVPLVLPPVGAELAGAALAPFAGLVLSGGEDVAPSRYGAAPHPKLGAVNESRDAWELALVEAARERRLPVLAICRGVQLLNVALGGTLVQDIPSEVAGSIPHDPPGGRTRRIHEIVLDDGSRLARAAGGTRFAVNSVHHQALDRVAKGLRVTARAADAVVEGVETSDDGWWVLGVQWHPEDLVTDAEPWERSIFAAFAERLRMGGASAASASVSRSAPAASAARASSRSGTGRRR